MDGRIKQLAEQAGIKFIPMVVDGVEYDHEDVEMDGSEDLAMFAESIVKECVDECLRMQLDNQYTPEEMLFQTKYRKIIKEHFGMEWCGTMNN